LPGRISGCRSISPSGFEETIPDNTCDNPGGYTYPYAYSKTLEGPAVDNCGNSRADNRGGIITYERRKGNSNNYPYMLFEEVANLFENLTKPAVAGWRKIY